MDWWGQAGWPLWMTQNLHVGLWVLLAAALTWLLRKRSAHLRHLVWLAVLVRCLVPPVFSIPVEVALLEPPPAAPAALRVETANVSQAAARAGAAVEPEAAPVARESGWPAEGIVLWIWLLGALGVAAVYAARTLRLQGRLRARRRPLSPRAAARLEALRRELGFAPTRFRVWTVAGLSEPFVWGASRGSLYLGEAMGSVAGLERNRAVIAHELAHIERRDCLVGLTEMVVGSLFWFHPGVWWAIHALRREREICCDESALCRTALTVRAYYRQVIDLLAESRQPRFTPVPAAQVARPVADLERRIQSMASRRGSFRRSSGRLASLTAALVVFTGGSLAIALEAPGTGRCQALGKDLAALEAASTAEARGAPKDVPSPLGEAASRYDAIANDYLQTCPRDDRAAAVRYRLGRLHYAHRQTDLALEHFATLIDQAPQSEYARYAAHLSLDILNTSDRRKELVEWTERFASNEALMADPDFNAEIRKLLPQATFALASSAAAKAKDAEAFQRAGQGFVLHAARFPSSELAPKALFNAASLNQRAGLTDQALQLYRTALERNAHQPRPDPAFSRAIEDRIRALEHR